MGIYIKGIKMPKSCNECPTCRDGTTLDGDYWLMCGYNSKPLESETAAEKPDWCPLILVPEHGRLIDADALIISTAVPLDGKPYQYVHINNIKGAPTIITTDKSDMDSFIHIFEKDDEKDGMESFIRILKD